MGNLGFPYGRVRVDGNVTGLLTLGLVALITTGCGASLVRAPVASSEIVAESPAAEPAPPTRSAGVHHRLQPGQTLWRLSRAYGVSLDELMRHNGIDDPSALEIGQSIFIPGAARVLDVPPYPAPAAGTTSTAPTASRSEWLWPVEGGAVISYFGAPRRGHRHTGVDIRGRQGQPVRAAKAGRVVFSASMRGYGKTVIVEHGDGKKTLYAHSSALLVRVGEKVKRGQAVARVGRSGNATTEHCHFEIRHNDVPIDPLQYLSSGAQL